MPRHLFEHFRKKVASDVEKHPACGDAVCCEIKLSLGVLLWAMGAVAAADGKFNKREEKKINDILVSCAGIAEKDLHVVMATVKQAAIGKIDTFKLLAGAGVTLSEEARAYIIEMLFRIAYADGELDPREMAIIRRAAKVFKLSDSRLRDIENSIKNG